MGGLHQCDVLLRLEPTTCCPHLVAELTDEPYEMIIFDSNEPVEIWQSPPALRADFRPTILATVLESMSIGLADWSRLTAARAVFRQASLRRSDSSTDSELLDEVSDCWDVAPICTSVVVVFWQRYLCEYARATGTSEMDLIMKIMPLKADRALPGDLLTTFRTCGW